MATSLLTEDGKQGAKVIGATGLNIRTGEFMVFKSRATVMCMSRPQRIWQFSTGFSALRPHTCIGNGHAMAWRAGAELTQMEKSVTSFLGSDFIFFPYILVILLIPGMHVIWLMLMAKKYHGLIETAK